MGPFLSAERQISLGGMVGGGRLMWVLIVPPSSSAWEYGEGERRYCENKASSSGVGASSVLDPSSSIRSVGEMLSYWQMPSSEQVSSESGDEVDWSGLSSGNRSSSNVMSIRETSDGFDETDIGNAPRSFGSSE